MQLAIFGLVFCVYAVCSEDIDAKTCHHEATNRQGICKTARLCDFAKEELKKGIHPQLCGFKTAEPIVCCPEEPQNRSIPIQLAKNRGIEVCRHKYFGIELGGNPYAAKTEFPHRALIGYNDSSGNITYLCLGSLISERYVLTAAHCNFSRISGPPAVVKLGESHIFKVARTIPHPDFKPSKLYNDIGLIEITDDVVFDENVKPACLESMPTNLTGKRATTIAWQPTYLHLYPIEHKEDQSRELTKVNLLVTSREECAKHYSPSRKLDSGVVDEMQICAGFQERGYGCRDDSGAALQVYSEDVLNVVGVASIARCFDQEASGVYTRVSHYIDWIREVVQGNSSL